MYNNSNFIASLGGSAMRTANTIFVLLMLSFTISAWAVAYGEYDPKHLLIPADNTQNKGPALDIVYLDKWLDDLANHAKNYPVQFDSIQDQRRASHDLKILSTVMDVFVNDPNPNPALLKRAGFINSMGHNLDLPGAAQKARSIFEKFLTILPADPQGNFMFGVFLGGVGNAQEALPYLQKVYSHGIKSAAYSIGMSFLMLKNNDKALEYLLIYQKEYPDDKSVSKLITAIQNGKIDFKHTSY